MGIRVVNDTEVVDEYFMSQETLETINYFTEFCKKFYEENWHFPSLRDAKAITGKSVTPINKVYVDWQSFIKIEFNINGKHHVACPSYELRLDENQEDWDYIGTAKDLQEELCTPKKCTQRKPGEKYSGYFVLKHEDTYNGIKVSDYYNGYVTK